MQVNIDLKIKLHKVKVVKSVKCVLTSSSNETLWKKTEIMKKEDRNNIKLVYNLESSWIFMYTYNSRVTV